MSNARRAAAIAAPGVLDGGVCGHSEHGLGRRVDGLVGRGAVGRHQLAVDQQPLFGPSRHADAPPGMYCTDRSDRHPTLARYERYARRESLSRQEHVGFSTEGDGMDQPEGRRTVAEFRAALCAWLDDHAGELAPRDERAGHARRPHRPDAAHQVDPVRCRLDAVRLARARRRTRLVPDAAHRARGRARGTRSGRSRALLAHRGARAHPHRVRPAGTRGRGGPATALGRRDVVPRVLRAGHRQRPGRPELHCGSRRRSSHRRRGG